MNGIPPEGSGDGTPEPVPHEGGAARGALWLAGIAAAVLIVGGIVYWRGRVAVRNAGIAREHYDNGWTHWKEGRTERAIAGFTKAIELKPDYAEAYENRGLLHAGRGDLDRAIADFTKAIAFMPDKYDAHAAYHNRGGAYFYQGDYDRAIADYTKAIELMADFGDHYCRRGDAYRDKGEHDLAMADYAKAIALDPDCPDAYFGRGVARLKKGDHALARSDFVKAIALDEYGEIKRRARERLLEMVQKGPDGAGAEPEAVPPERSRKAD